MISRHTFRRKLLLVVLASTLVALLCTGAAMLMYEVRSYRQFAVDDALTQAEILGQASAPALAFDDVHAAGEALRIVQAKPSIRAVALYNPRGRLFATFPDHAAAVPVLPGNDGVAIEGSDLTVFKRVLGGNQILGTIYVRAHYALYERVTTYLAILGLIMLVSTAVALLLSAALNRALTRPIHAIRDIARRVTTTRDFTLRARKTTTDEIGDLVDGFNAMLDEIASRASVLERSNRSLEHEVSERREVESALRVSEQRNRTLVAAVTAVVWNADRHGYFKDDQSSWRAYTGQGVEASEGIGWRSAVHPDDRAKFEVAWASALGNPAMFEQNLRLRHAASGAYRHIRLRAVPETDANGQVVEWIGAVDDIDDAVRSALELKKLNAELEQRVDQRTTELQQANRELETFSYSVSHDLRAPVRAIGGFAQMMMEDHGAELDQEAQRKLGIILGEARRMGALIDDQLAFSRLGRQSMDPVELNMAAMAREMFERLKGQEQSCDAELRLAQLPPVTADRALIDQVWANLIGNALKYSAKRARPVVEVGGITDDRENIYYVRDNGAGFDPRYKSKLFGVFQRLHDSSEFSGTGVGLALVQRIVLRHHGRVWAEGQVDKGASFYFALPREVANAGS
jgi:signal transduction histidine kinase/HAMP domain-containing protein